MNIPESKNPAQIKNLMPDRLVLNILNDLRFNSNSIELAEINVVEQFIENVWLFPKSIAVTMIVEINNPLFATVFMSCVN